MKQMPCHACNLTPFGLFVGLSYSCYDFFQIRPTSQLSILLSIKPETKTNKKNTKNWCTIDALGAIIAIFTILDMFTKLLQYFIILLQYYCNTITILLQYRVSVKKKGTFLVFVSFRFQRSDFTFSHVFRNHNFEPVSSSHSNDTHSESKLPQKR